MSKAISYLKFLLKSSNQHGIHSPFVYNFTTNCLYKKTEKNKRKKLQSFRQELVKNTNKIEVNDLGAGSKVFKNNFRAINRIAKYAGIKSRRANLLVRITEYFKPNTVLELGTSLGIGTSALYLGNPKASITTIEGCKNTAAVAKKQFEKFSFNTIKTKIGDFEEVLQNLNPNQSLDLVYFDGNHQKEATIKYFEFCLPFINNNSLFIFDDIHWSKEMKDAWKIIKNHPKVTVSIDTFQWGIVFFRKEQEKEHFIIRV